MQSPTADKKDRTLRAKGALVCPRCRADASAEEQLSVGQGVKVPRCTKDGYALVRAEALAEADGDPFLGTTVAARFVILGRIGAGSMGTVYRARQEAMGRDVAIKILRSDRAFDAQAKARFTREARAMSLLTSPHTVTVFDFGEIPDDRTDELATAGASLYLAMELLEGESLGQRLKRVRRLPTVDAVRIARQALLSLAEAHEKGVIHRDLKPDNLFIANGPPGSEAGELCKVLDFGIAKVVTERNSTVDVLETQAGTVFGTPRYMSPEQAQGKTLDPRSDLYSLGVLLYQMLVGRAPFTDDDAVVVMARHIKTVPAAPNEVAPELGIPAELTDVVMRALAKDPNDRPSSARAFVAELDHALSRPASERPPGRSDAPSGATGEMAALSRDDLGGLNAERQRSRRARLVVGGAVASLAIFGGLFALSTFRANEPAAPLRAAVQPHLAAHAETAETTADAPAPSEPAPKESGSTAPAEPSASASAQASAAQPAAVVSPQAPPKKPSRKTNYRRFDQ